MTGFTLYSSSSLHDVHNRVYRNAITVTDEATLRLAVVRDYVAAKYNNNYRKGENFLSSDCLAMDCDNDHSENPEQWITPEDILRHFEGVTMAFHYSRHHMKIKDGKSARPRFHCLFQIQEVTDGNVYANMKKHLYQVYARFDKKALDSARFFYGTEDPQVSFHPGTRTLTEWLAEHPVQKPSAEKKVIPVGQRNTELHKYAVHVLVRLGDTEKARDLYLKKSRECTEPLEDRELDSIWKSAQRFYTEKVLPDPKYVPPEQYAEEHPYLTYIPEDWTDVGEARMLNQVFGDKLRYSPATKFIVYNSKVWEESEAAAHGLMHTLTDMQLEEAGKALEKAEEELEKSGFNELLAEKGKMLSPNDLSEEQKEALKAKEAAEAYEKAVKKYRFSRNIKAVLDEVKAMDLIEIDKLDEDPYLLNTPDGAYDLQKGLQGAMPHAPEHFCTKITRVSPGRAGEALWKDALNLIFCEDQELIEYVQMVAGMAAIGKVHIEAMIIAYGDGRNGKSTFWNTICRALGTYGGHISPDALMVGCRRNVKPEMAEIRGKRLVIAAETEEGSRLSGSMVKQLCSTDDIVAEKKFKDSFSFKPSHTLVLYTNHLPHIASTDEGTLRRLIVVPFQAVIRGKSDIKNYSDYLLENAGGAVLSWVIEGAEKFIRNSFRIQPPACVREATREYLVANNWLGLFLKARCLIGEDLSERSGLLYESYRDFCHEQGENPRSTTEFYRALEKESFLRKKTREGMFVEGLQLRSFEGKSAIYEQPQEANAVGIDLEMP